jgi:hypothetical protein
VHPSSETIPTTNADARASFVRRNRRLAALLFWVSGFRLNPWILFVSVLLFAASLLLLKSRAGPEEGSDRKSGWRPPRDTR